MRKPNSPPSVLSDVRHIVNLGLHTHEKALPDEATSVRRLGMEYIHIPVDFGNPTEQDFQKFCAAGRLTKAFGFDLSPLALRCDEFKKIAADAQVERNRMRRLRRRAALARRGINQAVEELGVRGHDSDALRQLHREAAELVIAARACKTVGRAQGRR
jgi:hypothetical protein